MTNCDSADEKMAAIWSIQAEFLTFKQVSRVYHAYFQYVTCPIESAVRSPFRQYKLSTRVFFVHWEHFDWMGRNTGNRNDTDHEQANKIAVVICLRIFKKRHNIWRLILYIKDVNLYFSRQRCAWNRRLSAISKMTMYTYTAMLL